MEPKRHFFVPIISTVIIFYLIGTNFSTAANPNDWSKLSDRWRLSATVNNIAVRGERTAISIHLLLGTGAPPETGRHLKTDIPGVRLKIRLFENADNHTQPFERILDNRDFPPIDIVIDTARDSVFLGDVQLLLFTDEWPVGDRIWGQLELYVPSGEGDYWSGIITSQTFEISIAESQDRLEKFSFIVPRQIILAKGPQFSYDSTKVDTLTVSTHRDFYVVGITQNGGSLTSGVLRGDLRRIATTSLPFLPFLSCMSPLPGFNLFIDDTASINFDVKLYESVNMPEFHHGVHFQGLARLLWQDTFHMVLKREELRNATPRDEDEYYYHTCLIPDVIRLSNDKSITFGKCDDVAYELKVKKGYKLGYSIKTLGKREIECHDGTPQSPLVILDRNPTCNSPIDIIFRIFEYAIGEFPREDNRTCERFNTLWLSKCTISRDSGEFKLSAEDIRRPGEGWDIWKQCWIPSNFYMTNDGFIGFDRADMISVEFRSWKRFLPLLRLTINNEPPQLLSTFLQPPLAKWDRGESGDSAISVKIDVVQVDSSNVINAPYDRTLWSRTYQVMIPEIIGNTGKGGK